MDVKKNYLFSKENFVPWKRFTLFIPKKTSHFLGPITNYALFVSRVDGWILESILLVENIYRALERKSYQSNPPSLGRIQSSHGVNFDRQTPEQ